jgi:hypothetical protein
MSPALDRLRTEAALLDVDERARLAQELIESLDAQPATNNVEAQWIAEALRRVELMDRGEMATMSAQDGHAGAPIPGES